MCYYVFDKKSENQLLKKGSIAFVRIANREKQRKSDMYIAKLHYLFCIYFISFKLTCISQDSFVAKTIPFLGIFASTQKIEKFKLVGTSEFTRQTKRHPFKQFVRDYRQSKRSVQQVKSPAGDSIFFQTDFQDFLAKLYATELCFLSIEQEKQEQKSLIDLMISLHLFRRCFLSKRQRLHQPGETWFYHWFSCRTDIQQKEK